MAQKPSRINRVFIYFAGTERSREKEGQMTCVCFLCFLRRFPDPVWVRWFAGRHFRRARQHFRQYTVLRERERRRRGPVQRQSLIHARQRNVKTGGY